MRLLAPRGQQREANKRFKGLLGEKQPKKGLVREAPENIFFLPKSPGISLKTGVKQTVFRPQRLRKIPLSAENKERGQGVRKEGSLWVVGLTIDSPQDARKTSPGLF